MIEIKYNTRTFVDPKTNHVKIRVRWNKYETTFSLDCRAAPEKWDGKAQRPMPGTMHKFDDQNCSARIISQVIEESLEFIAETFAKCALDGTMPTKEAFKEMIRVGKKPIEGVKLNKTLGELYEEFMETASDDHNWTDKVHFKYEQMWKHLHECHPKLTLETLTKDKMRELKNWYVDKNYRNSTIKKQYGFLKTFLHWLQNEGYEINPGVLDYVPNLTTIPKTITFLKYDELMDFYHFEFSDEDSDLELVRDMFCFMAFTSLRYSDLSNLKRANVYDDHLDICTEKTDDSLTIPLTKNAKEIINKYKNQTCKNGKMFKVYANQKINSLLKIAAEKAGLDREVVLRYYKGKTRHEEVKKFYEIIGCHDARRTFVCCSLAFGIPPTVVMSCTGHSTYQAMRPYIEISGDTQRKELAKWDQEAEKSPKDDILKSIANADEETLRKIKELLNPPT